MRNRRRKSDAEPAESPPAWPSERSTESAAVSALHSAIDALRGQLMREGARADEAAAGLIAARADAQTATQALDRGEQAMTGALRRR
jgi:hypothetical protein